jgi:transcriptional regulator with XRE-family HTH domain
MGSRDDPRGAGVEGAHLRLLSQLERGLGNPTLETLHLLAGALRVRVAELVDVPGDEAKGDPLAARKLKPPKRGPKPKKATRRRTTS